MLSVIISVIYITCKEKEKKYYFTCWLPGGYGSMEEKVVLVLLYNI